MPFNEYFQVPNTSRGPQTEKVILTKTEVPPIKEISFKCGCCKRTITKSVSVSTEIIDCLYCNTPNKITP